MQGALLQSVDLEMAGFAGRALAFWTGPGLEGEALEEVAGRL